MILMRSFLAIIILFAGTFSFIANASEFKAGQELPRKIIAVYDSKFEGDPRYTLTHQFLEMPLNHLGFIVDYQDIRKPLRKLDDSVRGVVVWFLSDTKLDDPSNLFAWLHGAIDNKKKLLVMGGLGVSEKFRSKDDNLKKLNKLMHRIGVHDRNDWVNVVHNIKITSPISEITNFERKYDGEITPYMATNVVGSNAKSYLRLKAPDYEKPNSDLIITNGNGGYVARGYGIFQLFNDDEELVLTQWFINPFLFLQKVFDDAYLPKPDVTTILGNRIFYSHLDGDGWNNLTEVSKYKNTKTISAEVLYDEIFSKYTDFAFAVAPIVSELKIGCYGIPDSVPVARKIMKLHNVEPASHSYSHPLYWGFFADGDVSKEEKFMDRYPEKYQSKFFLSRMILGEDKAAVKFNNDFKPVIQKDIDVLHGIHDPSTSQASIYHKYDTPRSYACDEFSLDREVRGSVEYINEISDGKKVKLFQWSGDTTPFELALRMTREAGLYNINGGDSRFDTEYPSYATVSAISTVVGNERQIYSSNSNENTYTDLWTDRFFGFRYLQTTVNNTESPIRVKPYNLYFHSYSGQKDASLTALKENLEFARRHRIIPIFASQYAAIADSYFGVKIKKTGHDKWVIQDRGELQTIRIDNATLRSVDFDNSRGVIGQSYYQGSLYVALDSEVELPVIKLKAVDNSGEYELAKTPYVIESNWQIKGLQFSKNSLRFKASGFGTSDILIQMPNSDAVKIQLYDGEKIYEERISEVDVYNRIRLAIKSKNGPVGVSILMDKK